MSTYPDAFHELVRLSSIEVSTSLGLDGLSAVESPGYMELPQQERIAMLVFMGPEMNGAFSVCCSNDFVKKTNPVKVDSLDVDWMSEIANRVMGAVKARAAVLNVDFEASIPVTTTREDFYKASETIGPIVGFKFEKGSSIIIVDYCGVFARGVDFSGTPDTDAVIGGLGDAVIFSDD